ncbi:hypothetical protein BGZ70_008932 [Mortierella alpina]|uniref:Thioesterase domain-containing protein n=1 Tax=Mortierella alpina TaxID=64518 RepID=A0A9P6J2V5_MORAP|nr:hypothetical protein BGZ70_008932 [Mortierella alpina]
MSASAAMGALAYAKLDPASVGGFSGMPVGKIQPSIITDEEPDEPFQSSVKPTPEKIEEIKRSVLLQRQMEGLQLVHEYKDKALPNLPFHIGFTANLNVNYRQPVKADQFVMIKAEFEKGEGRKGYTVASIHDLHGNTLVECSALYVSPKNPVVMVANYVKNSLGFTGSS